MILESCLVCILNMKMENKSQNYFKSLELNQKMKQSKMKNQKTTFYLTLSWNQIIPILLVIPTISKITYHNSRRNFRNRKR